MGIKRHIPGVVATGATILYLTETIPKYLFRPKPENPIETILWAGTNVITMGAVGYVALKFLTYDKNDR